MSSKEIDYYGVLDVPRDATKEAITLSYRQKAIICNPHRCGEHSEWFTPPMCEENHLPALPLCSQWALINKAYDILSDPLRREVYDRYGASGLENGVTLPNGYFPPYTYHGDCFQTYKTVFGTYSPYANLIDAVTNPPPLYSLSRGIGVKVKDPDVEKVLHLDLKEIFYGAVKRMKIFRREFVDGEETSTEICEKILVITIPRGTLPGTRFTFIEEGDREPTKIPANITFITADKPHDVYKRNGSDLYIKHDISLAQALTGFKFYAETLDNRKVLVSMTDVITPGYVKEIKDEGLPKLNQAEKRGSLFVEFIIKFPKYIPRDLKCRLRKIFSDINAIDENKEN